MWRARMTGVLACRRPLLAPGVSASSSFCAAPASRPSGVFRGDHSAAFAWNSDLIADWRDEDAKPSLPLVPRADEDCCSIISGGDEEKVEEKPTEGWAGGAAERRIPCCCDWSVALVPTSYPAPCFLGASLASAVALSASARCCSPCSMAAATALDLAFQSAKAAARAAERVKLLDGRRASFAPQPPREASG